MINGIGVWVDTLLEAVEAKVASAGVVPRACVFSSEAADEDHLDGPPADRFVVIRPGTFPVGQPMVTGGGRLQTGFDSRFVVSAFARVQSDQELRSGRAMKGRDGTLALTLAVLTALQLYMPVDKGGNGLLREPMRLVTFDMTPRRMRAEKSKWSVIPSVWELRFTSNIGA